MLFLGLSSTKTQELLKNYPALCSEAVDLGDIYASVTYLKRLNITNQEILKKPTSVLLHQNTLLNRKKVIQECSFREVELIFLHQFVSLMNKKIITLKAFNYIDNNTDVQKNLLKLLDVEVSLMNEDGDDISLCKLRELIISLYLKEKLELTSHELKKLPETHLVRLKHRSLDSIVRAVNFLKNKLEFSNERIIKNAFLLYSSADNINRILTEVPKIGEIPMKEVLYRHPKLIHSSAESIKSIINHIKGFDIPEDKLLKSIQVLTLSPNTVYKRLVELKNIEEFNVLSSHPRILRLIYYQNKARTRLEYLKQLNVKCASLNLLSSASEAFEKYARDGPDKTRGHDTALCVASALNKDQHTVKQTFSRHPNWCHVPFVKVKESIEYLRSKNFTDAEISDNLYLLLYPVPLIEQHLTPLLQKKADNAYTHLIGGVVLSDIPNSKLLSVCHYLIEKEFHFSGEGIWESYRNDYKQDISNPVVPEFPKSLLKHYRYGAADKNRKIKSN